MSGIIKESTEHFENYDFSLTKTATEHFFWHDFCDNYLEIIKYRIYKKNDESAKYTLYVIMLNILKLFAPIIPHITEELYQILFRKYEKVISIHISKWPEPEYEDKVTEENGETAVSFITAARQWKHINKLPLNAELKMITIEKEKKEVIEDFIDDILGTTKAKKIAFGEKFKIE